MVFLPIQPSPAFSAMARSSTGALSTKARYECPPTAAVMRSASFCSRVRISLW